MAPPVVTPAQKPPVVERLAETTRVVERPAETTHVVERPAEATRVVASPAATPVLDGAALARVAGLPAAAPDDRTVVTSAVEHPAPGPSGPRRAAPRTASPRSAAPRPAPGVPLAGVQQLPTPPVASVRGRITIAAAAAGAVVAAGQTVVAPLLEATEIPPVTLTALQPVAETAPTAAFAIDAIGGDQLLPASITGMDAGTQVDVQNLTKAMEIGEELARQQALIDAALADGAPLANLVGDRVYVQPTTGRFTSGFGARWGRSHNGVDIAGPIGTPIYAFTDGVVEKAGTASGFGQWVVLRHADGTKTVYGHVNRFFVRVGEEVEAGDEIAEIGNRGFSTGPHLHFEVYDADDTPLDPRTYLDRRGVWGW